MGSLKFTQKKCYVWDKYPSKSQDSRGNTVDGCDMLHQLIGGKHPMKVVPSIRVVVQDIFHPRDIWSLAVYNSKIYVDLWSIYHEIPNYLSWGWPWANLQLDFPVET